ncbi:MAG TPA: hypothetical protein VEI97_18370, partial [bacterium]|nr:hypothetical protein [bacterium]
MELTALTADAPIAFGTDGVRGRVPGGFNLQMLTRLGKGVCTWLLEEGADGVLRLPGLPESMAKPFARRLLVGYDRRPDSAEFAAHLAKVCRAYGFVADLTPACAPTPALAFATRGEGYDCSLIVTASHNPYSDNGLKLKPHYGGSATGEITARVEAATADAARPVACTTVKETGPTSFDPFPAYAARLRELVPFRPGALPGVTIQFDPMHGATTGWFPRIVEPLGLTVNQLHADPPTRLTSLHPEPLAVWLSTLIEAVRSTPGSVGVACDGDGDRLGLVDEQGRFLSSQLFYPLILLSRLKLGDLPVPAIAKTFSGTLLLNRIAARYGLQLEEVPVGYKHISLMLAQGQVSMGG